MRTSQRIPPLGDQGQERRTYRIFAVNDTHLIEGVDGDPGAPGAVRGTRYHYTAPNLLRQFCELANREKPDLAIHLGDMVDAAVTQTSGYTLFGGIWAMLDVPRRLTTGNHEYDMDLTVTDVEEKLQHQERPKLGSSRFNQSFRLGPGVRIITVDTTYDAEGNHGSHASNIHLHPDDIDWLEDELLSSPEMTVLIMTHVLPHLHYFNSAQRTVIRNMVDSVIVERPRLRVSWFSGHYHQLDIVTYDNMGNNNPGYLLPALVEEIDGRFTEITVDSSGAVHLQKRELIYDN